MISRDLILTITDTNVSLNKSIILYRYDRGITLNIELKSDSYNLTDEIVKARAIVLRPNKKVSATPIDNIINGVYVLHLDNTWTDHLGEVGTYQIQLQLFSDNTDDECITIAPFTFEVKNPIGIPKDSAAYVDLATTDEYGVTRSSSLPTGDLDNGEYLETSWIGGDLITSGKLNKIESVIDYLVGESANHVDEEYVNEAISNIDIPDIPEVDLTNYATKDEIPPIRVIGSDDPDNPYVLTGNEFTDEEYENYWEGSVYFNNVSIMNYTFNDLFTVYLSYWDKISDGVMYKDIHIESAYSGGHDFDIHPYTGVIEENWHDYFAYREDLEAYATKDYVDEAIENIEISGGESECSLKVIGSSDSKEPHIFTGDEFTDEEWDRGGYYAVLFNNTAINEWIVNGLCDVHLAGRGLIYIWSPRLGFHEYWKDDNIWVESYSYQYATTSELEDVRISVNNCATKDELGTIENAANEIGTALIDFATYADTNYATKEELQTAIGNINALLDAINGEDI